MTRSQFLARFFELDRTLASAQHPALSPFWRATTKRFLMSSARTLVVRAGRRSGKSLTACKIACAFALIGEWTIPPGELAAIVIVSVSLNEAMTKIRLIRSMLDALHVPIARQTATEIELAGVPIIFRAAAAQYRSIVGFSSILIIVDEAARLRDDEGANPCSEIVSALKPTMATHRDARLLLISSPLGKTDFHAESFERGESADQQVARASTWEGNPTITEQETHELENDHRVWAREYLAEPQAGLLCAFEPDDVSRAFTPRGDIQQRFQRVAIVDASSGKSDVFAHAVAGWSTAPRGPVLEFDSIAGFNARQVQELGIDHVVAVIAAEAKAAGATIVFGDQRESLTLAAAFRRVGLHFKEMVWSAPSKVHGVAKIRRLLLEGRLCLPPHAALKREMLTFEEKVDNTGSITFAGHTGDHLSCLITAAIADQARRLPGSDTEGGSEGIDPSVFKLRTNDLDWAQPAPTVTARHTSGLDRIEMGPDGSLRIGTPVPQSRSPFNGRGGGF